MPLATLNPTINPSPGTQMKPKIALYKAEFGDGYTQLSPKGLNHIKQTLTLRWDGLTKAQMEGFKAFFEDKGGYRPFYYQPRDQNVPLKWTCSEWSITDQTPWKFEAKLEQSFTNET